jgi:plastocyanin
MLPRRPHLPPRAAALRATAAGAAEIGGRVSDAAGKPLADAVVFVQELPEGAAAPAPRSTPVLDQINKTFVPHVLPVVLGSDVVFPNHDQIHHHVYSFSRTKNFEIPLYKGEESPPVLFDKLGAVKVGCNIHDWMSAVILVVPTPYYAVTAADGTFTIADLPPGTYSLAAWHENSQTKVEETAKSVAAGAEKAEASFTLEISEAAPRVPVHGLRGLE